MGSSWRKYFKAVLNLLITVVSLVLIIWLVPKAVKFFLPFLIAWIIAMLASPLVRFLEKKLKIRRKAGSVFVVVLVIGLVILLGYLVCSKLIQELISFIQDIPDMWAAAEADFTEMGNNLERIFKMLPGNIQDSLDSFGTQAANWAGELFGTISVPTLAAVGNFAKQLPTIIIGVIMCLLSSYFFVAERDTVVESIKKVTPETLRYRVKIIKNSVFKAVGGYLKAQFKIEFWIYLLLLAGFLILQVQYAPLIALGVAFLDFLPFFGTGTAMVPWAVIKFFNSDYKMTIGLLILWGVSQLVRQLIQPKIVGDSVGVPPIPTLFLLYIGYMTGGVIGMIVAVPIGLIFITMYREGLFETTKNSIRLLLAGINHFRRLTDQDMEVIDSYRRERDMQVAKMARSVEQNEREAQAAYERAQEQKKLKKSERQSRKAMGRQKVQK